MCGTMYYKWFSIVTVVYICGNNTLKIAQLENPIQYITLA